MVHFSKLVYEIYVDEWEVLNTEFQSRLERERLRVMTDRVGVFLAAYHSVYSVTIFFMHKIVTF